MSQSYQLSLNTNASSHRLSKSTHLLAFSCAGIIVALAFSLPSENANSHFAKGHLADKNRLLNDITQVVLPLPELPEDGAAASSADIGDWRKTTVKIGDNLSSIFARLGVKAEDLYALLASSDEAKALASVMPGQVFKIRTDATGALLELVHEVDEIHGTRISRANDTFTLSHYKHAIEKRMAFGTGVIKSSLYQSVTKAGLSDRLVMKLAEIFGWDIDFALDIQPGDRFSVLYEEEYFAGEKLGVGDILAAEFINNGKIYKAIRFTDAQGFTHYYTPEGQGMRQAFLRTPVDFRRISSHFQQARWHPVLGVKRPHRGVDYVAATGTPIKAVGDATVIFIGRKGGYGKTVILRHQKRYTTLYAHMSGFKKGLSKGDKVEQGEVIGYVGQTGLASGPHLHYEFRVDGVHKNPMTVKLPGSPPIDSRYMAAFRKQANHLVSRLELHRRLASNTAF